MIRLILRVRFATLAVVIGLLSILIAADRRVGYEQSIRSFFDDSDPAIRDYRAASDAFGDDNFVFIVYDDPKLFTAAGMDRVRELARSVAPGEIPGVLRVESLEAMPLAWKIDEALLALDRLPAFARDLALNALKRNLANPSGTSASEAFSIGAAARVADSVGLASLKEKAVASPLLAGTLVSPSGESTAIVLRLDKNDRHNTIDTVAALRARADSFARRNGLRPPAVVGPPVLLADGFSSIEADGRRLAAMGMILIGLVTLSATRSVWWAIVPILASWTVWLSAEALMSWLNLRLSLSGGPLVAQIIVLTMPAASHLAVHFRDVSRTMGSREAASTETLGSVSSPIFWCALSGAIGYGALLTSSVVPVRQFGWIMAVCTAAATLLTLLLAPVAMLPPFRLELPGRIGSPSRDGLGMGGLSAFVMLRPRWILASFIAVVVPLAGGAFRLEYQSNYINAFKPSARVVRDYFAAESRLGGIGVAQLIVPGVVEITPESVDRLRGLSEGLTERASPGARAERVLSLATALEPDRPTRPLAEEARSRLLRTKLDLVAASPQGELLRSFWNSETGQARLLIRIPESRGAEEKAAVFAEARRLGGRLFGSETYVTGLSYLMTRMTRGLIRTQWSTFAWSFSGVFLIMMIALGGPVPAILACLPSLSAVGFVLGLMGYLAIPLDMATALVAGVALGLSVDDAFHCLLEFRRRRRTDSFEASLAASYAVTGPGVLLSSLAVGAGFLGLRLSEFVPFSNFGTMVCIATAGGTLGNLVLLPACLTLREALGRGRSRGVAPRS